MFDAKGPHMATALAPGVLIVTERSSAHPVEYAIVLLVQRDNTWHTVRAFDNAHDPEEHHEHRYVGSEKQDPIVVKGPVNEAMHAAETKLEAGWSDIIRVGEHKMSAINEKTSKLFKAAWESDDDLGYPNGVEFVPADEEWADEVVWRNLSEGRANACGRRGDRALPTPGHVPCSTACATASRSTSPHAWTATPPPTRRHAASAAAPCARCASYPGLRNLPARVPTYPHGEQSHPGHTTGAAHDSPACVLPQPAVGPSAWASHPPRFRPTHNRDRPQARVGW